MNSLSHNMTFCLSTFPHVNIDSPNCQTHLARCRRGWSCRCCGGRAGLGHDWGPQGTLGGGQAGFADITGQRGRQALTRCLLSHMVGQHWGRRWKKKTEEGECSYFLKNLFRHRKPKSKNKHAVKCCAASLNTISLLEGPSISPPSAPPRSPQRCHLVVETCTCAPKGNKSPVFSGQKKKTKSPLPAQ